MARLRFARDVLLESSHLRSNGDSGTSQNAYTYQIILEKNEVGPCPSVQQLLETSFVSCDLKFEEVGKEQSNKV